MLWAAVVALGQVEVPSAAEALALTLLAWFGLGGLGIALSLALVTGADPADLGVEDPDHATTRAARLPLARRTATWRDGPVTVVEVEDPTLVATVVTGGGPTVFLAAHVRRALADAPLRALVAHERAHLGQHHALLRHLGAWHAACLPKRSELRRLLARRIHLLTELAADDAAASRVGHQHLAAALRAVDGLAPDPALTLRADRMDAAVPAPPRAARAAVGAARPAAAR